MIELDTIYNEDCLTGMQRIPDGSVDCIICDLPYGTMKGAWKGEGKHDEERHDWDDIIPTDKLFEAYGRVLRRNGVAVLFSQEPYTSHLRTFKGTWMEFCYPMIWKKNHFGMSLNAKHAPVSYFEDLSVFVRRSANDAEKAHPLRDYSRRLLAYIGKTQGQVQDDFRQWGIPKPTRVAHFLAPEGLQFILCTEETYNLLIEHYGIDKWEGFRTWQDLKAEEQPFLEGGRKVFNLPEGEKTMSNILDFAKDKNGCHPTQKPVDLIAYLIRTYSNPGDTILDNTIGSGTTAVAALREKRHFIGFELNRDYYDIALRRIKLEQQQQTLF